MCAWSDYHPGGGPQFGHMFCFRELQNEYELIAQNFSKNDFFNLVQRPEVLTVQETYLCGQFARREAGRGYRG
jgi:hypothetical protein